MDKIEQVVRLIRSKGVGIYFITQSPLTENERRDRIARSPLKGRYDEVIDRESAYETLRDRAEEMQV